MKFNFWAVLLVVLSLFLNIWGINWGVPDDERISLVFGSREIISGISGIMKESRDDIRSQLESPLQEQKYEEKSIGLDMKGKTVHIPRSQLDGARSFLIRSYGGDEQRPLVSLSGMKPGKLDLNPRMYFYGGFYLYGLGAFLKMLSVFKLVTVQSNSAYYFINPSEMGKIFIAARAYSAIFASLAVYLMYMIGALLFNRKTGLIAALFFCLTPGVVLWSHYLSPFAFTLFWLNLSLYFCAQIYKTGRFRYYILSGVFAGLASGALIHYGYVLLGVPLAHFLRSVKEGNGILLSLKKIFSKKILISLCLFLACFLAVNPYYVISLKTMIAEFRHAKQWWRSEYSPRNWAYHFVKVLPYQFGWLIWIAAAAGLVFAAARHTAEDIFFLALTVPLYIYISSSTTYYAHYGLPLVPFMLMPAAAMLGREGGFPGKRIAFSAFIAAIALYTFALDVSYDRIFAGVNIRTQAGRWIDKEIPKGSSVGMLETPSPWRTPPINPFRYRIVVTARDSKILEKERPEYYYINEFQWMRGVSFPVVRDFISGYEEIKRFEQRPRLFGITLVSGKDQPWDWPSPNPLMIVYKRRAHGS